MTKIATPRAAAQRTALNLSGLGLGAAILLSALGGCSGSPSSTSSSPDGASPTPTSPDGSDATSANAAADGPQSVIPAADGDAPNAPDGGSSTSPEASPADDASTSGSTAEASSSSTADGSSGSFALAWQDNFDALDLRAWQLQTFTFGGNTAQFSTQNAAVANGVLTISLTVNPSSTTEPYFGVEMRSAKTLKYGRVSARMRFAHGSGVVSGLVLFYTPFPNCNWNEIDIEHLGNSASTSQLNSQVFTGTPNPQCTASVTPTVDPLVVPLGFDAEVAFHQYDITWTPAGVTTAVDGTDLRNWTKYSALMNLPQTVLLTIWASSAASWAGALTAASAPTSADVDWIKVYDWHP
ncbi:MAG: glycoside hydrolase family 16 protein [Myxococcota bacterium]|nr:glycoside hydrolase family 16 protein [Myxococcota bacterium]